MAYGCGGEIKLPDVSRFTKFALEILKADLDFLIEHVVASVANHLVYGSPCAPEELRFSVTSVNVLSLRFGRHVF